MSERKLEDDKELLEQSSEGEELPEEELEGEELPEEEESPEQGELPLAAEDKPQPSRAQRAIINARKRAQEAEAEAKQYRQYLMDMQKQQLQAPAQQQQVQQPNPADEQRLLENMSEAQRVQYYIQKGQNQTQTEMRRLELMMAVQKDHAEYQAHIAADPEFYGEFAPQVETLFQQYLSQGQPRERVIIENQLIGEKVKKERAEALKKAQRAGASRIAAQRTKPGSVRSSASVPAGSRPRESAEDTLRRRLENREYGF